MAWSKYLIFVVFATVYIGIHSTDFYLCECINQVLMKSLPKEIQILEASLLDTPPRLRYINYGEMSLHRKEK